MQLVVARESEGIEVVGGGRERERERDRQTDRQTERERERERESHAVTENFEGKMLIVGM